MVILYRKLILLGNGLRISLEVPPIRIHNNCMMNKIDAEDVVYDLTENLYWDMADSLDDEGQGKLDDLVEDFREKAIDIVMKYSA